MVHVSYAYSSEKAASKVWTWLCVKGRFTGECAMTHPFPDEWRITLYSERELTRKILDKLERDGKPLHEA